MSPVRVRPPRAGKALNNVEQKTVCLFSFSCATILVSKGTSVLRSSPVNLCDKKTLAMEYITPNAHIMVVLANDRFAS